MSNVFLYYLQQIAVCVIEVTLNMFAHRTFSSFP